MEFADKAVRADRTVQLEHGKPMVFGKERDKGIRLNGTTPEIVTLGNGVSEADLWVHDETRTDPTLSFMLSRMHWPQYPEPMGVIRALERPTYEDLVQQQVDEARERQGDGDLDALFMEGDTWTVE
jgi:2-oxoglutarate ferredoxin oxidoreductase subunit beta